jgi:regulator of nucleoside diphosphate kinase
MTTATLTQPAAPVILLKNDFDILTGFVKNLQGMQVNEKENFKKLNEELKKAQIVDQVNLPKDVVRLNSTVVVKDLQTKREMTITIVLPQHADIKQKKVSVMAPIGTALIGFRKGQKVSWDVPSGKKDFMIMEVSHSSSLEKGH